MKVLAPVSLTTLAALVLGLTAMLTYQGGQSAQQSDPLPAEALTQVKQDPDRLKIAVIWEADTTGNIQPATEYYTTATGIRPLMTGETRDYGRFRWLIYYVPVEEYDGHSAVQATATLELPGDAQADATNRVSVYIFYGKRQGLATGRLKAKATMPAG